jgi:predicted RNA-binding protein YlqC (UPF0109 family)
MDDKAKDLKFLEAVVGFLAEHPEAIKINRVVDEMGVLLTLDVHPDDMRQVIGREGNTAKAIRTLLRVVGMKANARVNLKINEPEGATPRPPRQERPERGFDRNGRGGYGREGNDRGGYGRGGYNRSNRSDYGSDDHGYAN